MFQMCVFFPSSVRMGKLCRKKLSISEIMNDINEKNKCGPFPIEMNILVFEWHEYVSKCGKS